MAVILFDRAEFMARHPMRSRTFTRAMLIALMLGTVLPCPLFAGQTDTGHAGTVAAPFLQLNSSVRSAALGGYQAALSGDLQSQFSNPAGLANVSSPELWFSHNQSIEKTKVDSLGFASNLKSNALSFAIQQFGYGSADRVDLDASGNPVTGQGSFSFSTTLLEAGWARPVGDSPITEKIAVGAVAKGWRDSQAGTSKTGWAGDIGVQCYGLLFQSLDLGLSARNFGPSVDGYNLPRSIAIGGAYHIVPHESVLKRVSVFSELDIPRQQSAVLRSGFELNQNWVWERLGFENVNNHPEDSLSRFSFGAGIRIKNLKLDYAWSPQGDLGDIHRLSLQVGFGLTPEEKRDMAKNIDAAIQKRSIEKSSSFIALAQQAMKEGKWKVAQGNLETALIWSPRDEKTRELLQSVQDKARYSESRLLYQEGMELFQDEQWLDAALKWEQVLKIDPKNKNARQNLIVARDKMARAGSQRKAELSAAEKAFDRGTRAYLDGRYDDAINEWMMVKKLAPGTHDINTYIVKAKNMKLTEEVTKLKKEAAPENSMAETLSQEAYTWYSLGQIDKAVENWEKVLVLDPSNADAKAALKEARARKNLSKNESPPQTSGKVTELNAAALKNYREGNLDAAAANWRKALQIDPHNVWIRSYLNRVEREITDRENSR